MRTKLNCPEFLNLINSYDILGIQETKTDDLDTIDIPGYKVILNNRSCISRTRSGGVGLIVKEWVLPFLKVHDTKSTDLAIFFTLSKILYRNGQFEDLMGAVVYIPPHGSRYASEDPFLEMQETLFKYCSKGSNDNLLIFGDINSRSSNLADYVQLDYHICNSNGLRDLFEENIKILKFFETYKIPLNRTTADYNINAYGSSLLEFCKNNNFFILNGRIGSDYADPKLTCKERSTVDYFLSTANVFEYLKNFQVLEFDNLFSDAHCAVSLTLTLKCNVKLGEPSVQHKNIERPVYWRSDEAEKFKEKIDILKVSNIEINLDRLIDADDITETQVNEIVGSINVLFENCAKESFGSKIIKNKNKYSSFKPWFNRSCANARNIFHKTRKMYNTHKTDFNKSLLKSVSKNYKNTLSKNFKHFKTERIEKLRRLKTRDPKQYWKIINADKKTNECSAPLGDLFNFYKSASELVTDNNSNENVDNDIIHEDINLSQNMPRNESDDELNGPITPDEILRAVKSLKNNKSPGLDNVLNEHLKSTVTLMCPLYVKLFNVILDTGIVPECWTLGNIRPIFKNKGDPKNPENYRPITLLSNFGKLFTAVINNRLNRYAEKNDLIGGEQAGFRKQFSTTDNLFILRSLIDITQSSKKKLFCCFIDFKQAFDTIWRAGLWRKLVQSRINGKCFKFIHNMYSNIKSKVTTNEGSSQFFNCNVGVRQGENLSPFLFSIFLNDLENYLRCNYVSGVDIGVTTDEIHIFLKLFILLYADDTVIFSDNKDQLQYALDIFDEYCKMWRLTVNVQKTKIVIFSKGKAQRNFSFKFQNETIEITKEYKYLGLFMGQSGSYVSAKKHITEQASRASFALMKKIRNLDLPIDIQIDLFNKTVKPILLYGCELWGTGNIDMIERIQLKFYKQVLNLKKSTPSNMIYGELGVMPLYIDIQTRIISFWTKLVQNTADNKLSSVVYNIAYELHAAKKIVSPWQNCVKNLLCSLGFPVNWYSQSFINAKWLVTAVNQKLKDVFIQSWRSNISIESESNIYRILKTNFEQSAYMNILPLNLSKLLLKYRTRNHHLPVELGRWRSVPYNERRCAFCNHDIGDEYHMLLTCSRFENERHKYIKRYYYLHPNIIKFEQLMNCTNRKTLFNLCFFVKIITSNTAP